MNPSVTGCQGRETYCTNTFFVLRISPSFSHLTLCLAIRSTGKQTDYISLKENVMGMSQQLNKINMEDMMVAATNLSSAPLSNTQQFNGGGF